MAVVCWGAAARATNIDTKTEANGRDFLGSYGVPNTTTFGQTITLPFAEELDNFTFYAEGDPGASTLAKPYVYAWDGSKATGQPLFTGNQFAITFSSSFTAYSINTNATRLPAGRFVLFFTSSNDAEYNGSKPNISTVFELDDKAGDPGGTAVFLNNGNSFSGLTSQTWGVQPTDANGANDFAFQATLVNLPEPTSLGVILFAAPTLLRRRRFC